MGNDQADDVLTGSGWLPKLATICGMLAAATYALALASVGDGEVHEHLGRAAVVLTVAAIVLFGQTLLDRRTAARMAALDALHRAEWAEAGQRHAQAMVVMHSRQGAELQEAEQRHQREQRAAEERHERDVQHHLTVLEKVLCDRSQGEARAREQGRVEMEQIYEVRLASVCERHEHEMAQALAAERERARAERERAVREAVAEAIKTSVARIKEEAHREGVAKGTAETLAKMRQMEQENGNVVRRFPPVK